MARASAAQRSNETETAHELWQVIATSQTRAGARFARGILSRAVRSAPRRGILRVASGIDERWRSYPQSIARSGGPRTPNAERRFAERTRHPRRKGWAALEQTVAALDSTSQRQQQQQRVHAARRRVSSTQWRLRSGWRRACSTARGWRWSVSRRAVRVCNVDLPSSTEPSAPPRVCG